MTHLAIETAAIAHKEVREVEIRRAEKCAADHVSDERICSAPAYGAIQAWSFRSFAGSLFVAGATGYQAEA